MLAGLISNIIQKGSSSLLVLAFTGATLATSGVAGAKLYNEISTPHEPENIELQSEADVLGVATEAAETDQTEETAQQIGGTADPTPSPAANNGSTTQASTTTGGCVIQLFGKNYDVAPLKLAHPGGDIFVCGTDMSATYQSQHGTDVSRMAAYEISISQGSSGSSQTSGSSNTQNNGTTSSFKHEEEREDREYHEEAERHFEQEDESHDDDHEDDHHDDHDSDHESDHDHDD